MVWSIPNRLRPFLLAALLLEATAALGTSLAPPAARGQAPDQLDVWKVLAMDRTAFRMRAVALLPVSDEPGQSLVYGDRYGIVRVVHITERGVRELWRSRTLEGPVLEVLVEDLDGDGTQEIIVRTQGGRLYVFDSSYNLRWENVGNDYQEISCMAIANMDDDPAYEIVVLGDGRLDYIDGAQFNRQFRSTQTYSATEMAIGNVDNDFPLEIVLNSGLVVDSALGEPDWKTDPFGTTIELLDIDGDGIEEVLGSTVNGPMRIFDVNDQQEKPLQ